MSTMASTNIREFLKIAFGTVNGNQTNIRFTDNGRQYNME